jgi:hypothetical protein
MANEEEKISITLGGKKRNINVKKVIKIVTILVGLILIVLMTITNITFDLKNFNWTDWVTNALVLTGIMVFGLLMGESVGNDTQTTRINGMYQHNLSIYQDTLQEVKENEVYFPQFYSWFKEEHAKQKRIDYLVDNGFDLAHARNIVLYLSSTEVEELTHRLIKKTIEGKDVYIRKITEAQKEYVNNIFSDKLKLETPSYSYYLSAFSSSNRKDILEQPYQFEKDIILNKRFSRAWKILFSLFISLVWATMTVQNFVGGNDAQAWLNLVSRLTAFCSSFVAGWGSSVVDVKIRANAIDNKTKVLQYFLTCLEKKDFMPTSYEDTAKEEYEEQKAKEVVGEIVESVTARDVPLLIDNNKIKNNNKED